MQSTTVRYAQAQAFSLFLAPTLARSYARLIACSPARRNSRTLANTNAHTHAHTQHTTMFLARMHTHTQTHTQTHITGGTHTKAGGRAEYSMALARMHRLTDAPLAGWHAVPTHWPAYRLSGLLIDLQTWITDIV
jgi:hypothetical protein